MALEAITGEATIAERVSTDGVHQRLINTWKRRSTAAMADVFWEKAEEVAAKRDGEVRQRRAKTKPVSKYNPSANL